ncbi:hypothetical protein EJB05_04527, partial [Eragrostis curvula]
MQSKSTLLIPCIPHACDATVRCPEQSRQHDRLQGAKPLESTTRGTHGHDDGLWAAGIASTSEVLATTIGVGVTKTVFILTVILFVDRVGRRPLYLSSLSGIIALASQSSSVLRCTTHRGGGGGAGHRHRVHLHRELLNRVGSITWAYSSEVYPLRLRAQGARISMAINRIVDGSVSITFVSLYKAVTIGGAFFLLAGLAVDGVTCDFLLRLLCAGIEAGADAAGTGRAGRGGAAGTGRAGREARLGRAPAGRGWGGEGAREEDEARFWSCSKKLKEAARILTLFPQLRRLQIQCLDSWSSKYKRCYRGWPPAAGKIACLNQHLTHVRLQGYCATRGEQEFATFLMSQAMSLTLVEMIHSAHWTVKTIESQKRTICRRGVASSVAQLRFTKKN